MAAGVFAALPAGGSASGVTSAARAGEGRLAHGQDHLAKPSSAVWLCRPGMPDDPCTANLATTVIGPLGSASVVKAKVDTATRFDYFYVYPTGSNEQTANADLRVQATEIDAAIAQASRFSTACRVRAPMYRQITLTRLFASPLLSADPAATVAAYHSLQAGFEDYLKRDNDGRPIIFIGHSQGASMLILLLQRVVDHNPALRRRLVLAIILGGTSSCQPALSPAAASRTSRRATCPVRRDA